MSQEKLNEWLKKYQHDYVAHAIWDKIKEVFESGEVMSAEEVLRKTKKVSYEKGQMYGKRGEAEITKELEEAVKNTPLPQLVRIVENYPFEDFQGKVVHIYPLWYEKQTSLNNEQLVKEHTNKISEIQTKTGASITEIQVAADMYSQDSIDNRLSRVWQANAKKNESNKHLREELADARHHEIKASPLCIEIRMLYCEINWSYGDVVVLRGNATDKVYSRGKKPGSFAYTIEPYENGGKFPKIELSDERTLILGPEKILAPYRQNPNYASFNIIYIEELSLEQLEIFDVPNNLFIACISKLLQLKDYKKAFQFLKLAEKSKTEIDRSLQTALYSNFIEKLTAEVQTSASLADEAIMAVKMIMKFLKNDPLSQENIELLKIEAKQLLTDAKYANRISGWEREIDEAQGIKSLDERIQTIISTVNKMPSMFYYVSSKMEIGDSELISKLKTFREKTLAPLVSQQANTHSTYNAGYL